jgi:hypothetical protein
MPSLLKRLSYRVLTATMLPRLRAARALIGLCHHRFETTPGTDPIPGMAVTPEALTRQIEVLSRIGRFVSLEEAFDPDPAPGLRFWLSFDDGYRDNAGILPPILARLGVPATLFITHGFVTGEIPALEHDLATGHTPPGHVARPPPRGSGRSAPVDRLHTPSRTAGSTSSTRPTGGASARRRGSGPPG